jgi:cation:H+ antiporter
LRFGLASAGVIAAGIWLALIGDEITTTYGWQSSFVGSLFLAVSTSLPETAVGIACLRLGAIDMAVAEILGSNMFDIVILFFIDLAYRQGPLFSSLSSVHLMTIVLAIVMTLVVMVGIRFPQKIKAFRFIAWHSAALMALYGFGMYCLYVSI